MSDTTFKRRRVEIEGQEQPVYKLDDEDNDDYVPYVPINKRKQARFETLTKATREKESEADRLKREREEKQEQEDEERAEERRREKARRERTLLLEAQQVHSEKAAAG